MDTRRRCSLNKIEKVGRECIWGKRARGEFWDTGRLCVLEGYPQMCPELSREDESPKRCSFRRLAHG